LSAKRGVLKGSKLRRGGELANKGKKLPEIMQRVKQTFAVRFNVLDGRTGHIWGDRYWSKIVDGPPEDAEEYVFAPVDCKAGRRVRRKRRRGAGSGGGLGGRSGDGR
jgi:hypothetical protein